MLCFWDCTFPISLGFGCLGFVLVFKVENAVAPDGAVNQPKIM